MRRHRARCRLWHVARLAPLAFCGAATVLVAIYSLAGRSAARPSMVHSFAAHNAPAVPGIEQLLSNAFSTSVQEETLSCVDYSGPCFFMNHPAGDAPTHPVPAAHLDVPMLLQPTVLPLSPVSLHDVRLLPGTRFHSAQQTNLRWLRSLNPDQLLFWFRNLSGIRQPRGVRSHGGWDGAGTGLRGHILGHYLSAAAMAAAATGDDAMLEHGRWVGRGLLRRNLENVTRGLEACQAALGDGYVSGFPDAEFRQMEDYPAPRYAWVPYYVMHKLLGGLVDYHRLWRSERALSVAVKLAEHLWKRVDRILRRGVERWYTFINQEVGGMSEVLTDLAVATRNATWLVLAARFERPCFVAPLALAYQQPQPPPKGKGAAAHAIERMHGNTHLPQLLGAMARYEATGDGALRGAAEAFWREIGHHQFVTGGSTVNEVWKGARTLGDVVSQHGQTSFGAHDVHETCVSHNSMRVSRRLLMWGGPAREGDGRAHTLAHADYYERTMLNAVLGTQRGTNPGQMLYMFPMGGGVAKSSRRSGSELHHWGDHTTHWCCQGSGIEAFARLTDSIFWRHNPAFTAAKAQQSAEVRPQLFVLQHISSRLRWREQHCTVELLADTPGSRGADEPLQTTVRLVLDDDARDAGGEHPAPFVLWVRVPGWAHGATAAASGGLQLAGDGPRMRQVAADSLLPVVYVRGQDALGGLEGDGRLTLRWSMRLRWEKLSDSREHFQMLQAAMWGPLVLAALTYGDRTLPDDAQLTPVPPEARRQLFSLQHVPSGGSQTLPGSEGCLVTRWEHVWIVWRADRSRSFLTSPSRPCVARATPVNDEIADWPQRDGGKGARYKLDAPQSEAACRTYEGCLPGTGDSPFASGALHAMHNGIGKPLVLTSRPPAVKGTRRGGTDAANAATWRLTPTPLGLRGGSAADGLYLESFDSPGHVLSVGAASTDVALRPLRSSGAAQRWRVVLASGAAHADDSPCSLAAPHLCSGSEATLSTGDHLRARRVTLQSMARPGMALRVAPLPPRPATLPPPPLLHLGAFASRTSQLMLGAAADASEFVFGEAAAEYPSLALWAAPPPAAETQQRATYLMIPLNEVVDEHYSVYMCRLAARGTRPPPFCLE